MLLLLPFKWFILQCFIFIVMVVIEAIALHYIEGVPKKWSVIYLFLVNLFSFNFGWLIVTLTFYLLTKSTFQDEILGYMLLGIVIENFLVNLKTPFSEPLLATMALYFCAICYFELKMLTVLKKNVLPMVQEVDGDKVIDNLADNSKKSSWLYRCLTVFLPKDWWLALTVVLSNFVSHLVVGGLIFLTQA